MCGIAGAVWNQPADELKPHQLQAMLDRIRHRGPDDQGTSFFPYRFDDPRGPQPGAALGFRRLTILDLTTGNQPLANETGTVQIVLNGEIYNYRALIGRLTANGHQFRSQGDVETAVHLYEELGPRFVEHLEGMFAFALWDTQAACLLLGRDRLGKKPLYYYRTPHRLLFASELKALLALPEVPRAICPLSLDAYLTYQYVPHPRTIFRDIYKLCPGELACWRPREGSFTIQRFWKPDLQTERSLTREAAIAELQTLFPRAVEQRLQSDVPLGVFLSGGVDSSLVAGWAARLSPTRLKTFSVGFPVPAYDESAAAAATARRLGTEHYELKLAASAVELLPRLAWHFDEPFGDSSAIPTWCLAEFARQQITVALTGDGGDELFAGYDRYQALAWAAAIDRWPLGLREAIRSAVLWSCPDSARYKSRRRRLRRFLEPLLLRPAARYLEWIGVYKATDKAQLYSPAFKARLHEEQGKSGQFTSDFLDIALAEASGRDPVTQFSLADMLTYLPGDLLCKVDIASMAHGLECRQPFLDFHLAEWSASLPLSFKRQPRPKGLLAEAFPDLLPPEVMQRRKMGFGVPLDQWFRKDLHAFTADKLLNITGEHPYFESGTIARYVREHTQGTRDHSGRLWLLLMFEAWRSTWSAA